MLFDEALVIILPNFVIFKHLIQYNIQKDGTLKFRVSVFPQLFEISFIMFLIRVSPVVVVRALKL